MKGAALLGCLLLIRSRAGIGFTLQAAIVKNREKITSEIANCWLSGNQVEYRAPLTLLIEQPSTR
jgi:hypothetical protein